MNFLLGNPLLPLAIWTLLFLILWAFRYNWSIAVSLTIISLLVAMLLLPGGQKVADQTSKLASVGERAKCLGDSIESGTFWNQSLPPSCVYRGRPLLP